MAFTELTDTQDIVDRWPYNFQYISDTGQGTYDITGTLNLTNTVDIEAGETTLWEYLSIFATELGRIDGFINKLYEQRFLETATGRELEKLAAPLGVTRRANEDDEALRYRARLGKLIAASDGTASTFETVISVAFADTDPSNIEVGNVSDAPIINVLVPETQIDQIPITVEETEDLLTRSVPAGHAVRVVTDDTWLLGESGNSGLGEGGLT